MRVGVDYTAAVWQGAGIGRYTRELIGAALAQSPELRLTLLYAAGGLAPGGRFLPALRALCAAHPGRVRPRPIPLSPRLLTIIWQRLRLPLRAELLAGPFELLHAPDFVLPPTRARTLLTVHDLTFLVEPESAERRLRRYLAAAVPRSLRRADLVLVDSQATAADLARLLGVAGPRVRLLYPGVDPRFRPLPAAECAPVRAALGLPARFLLFVGTLEPRKNLVRLVAAFEQLLAAGDPAHADLHLVLAGRPGWQTEPIFAAAAASPARGRIRFLDFVADEQLPALYNLAEAFVYPSLYEGFGLPVLEALACGAPTLSSAVSSIPEVAGQAAVLADPHDSAALAAGLRQTLAEAGALRLAGPPQAARFGWGEAAARLIQYYQEAAG